MIPLDSISPNDFVVHFSQEGLKNHQGKSCHLADLKTLFIDDRVCSILIKENPLVYSVSSVQPAQGEGQLHYGHGILYPGKVGDEYFFTRGHYHACRSAAEVYIILSGTGAMLLEDEQTQKSHLLPLSRNTIIYVPAYTAHRTINTGDIPLSYLGIYPANAGHDYAPIAEKNFRKALIDVNGKPTLVERNSYSSK